MSELKKELEYLKINFGLTEEELKGYIDFFYKRDIIKSSISKIYKKITFWRAKNDKP